MLDKYKVRTIFEKHELISDPKKNKRKPKKNPSTWDSYMQPYEKTYICTNYLHRVTSVAHFPSHALNIMHCVYSTTVDSSTLLQTELLWFTYMILILL